MDLTLILTGVIVSAIAIWIFMELRRFKHRIFAVFIVLLFLVIYFSFAFVSLSKSVNLSGFNGIKEAGGFYFSWLGSVFSNVRTLAGNAVKMNWSPGNSTLNSQNSSGN